MHLQAIPFSDAIDSAAGEITCSFNAVGMCVRKKKLGVLLGYRMSGGDGDRGAEEPARRADREERSCSQRGSHSAPMSVLRDLGGGGDVGLKLNPPNKERLLRWRPVT